MKKDMGYKKTTFTVLERLLILDIVPTRGNFMALKFARQLYQMLQFSFEEQKLFKFEVTKKPDGGQATKWDNSKPQGVEFELNERQIAFIGEILKQRSNQGSLETQHLDLYVRFVGEDEDQVAEDVA